jgi:hypothetical protein
MEFPDTLNALVVAKRIAERLDEDCIPYGVGGALALGAWGAPRSTKDVDITVFVLSYVRGWLTRMVPDGDPRLAVLDDLERRFARRP